MAEQISTTRLRIRRLVSTYQDPRFREAAEEMQHAAAEEFRGFLRYKKYQEIARQAGGDMPATHGYIVYNPPRPFDETRLLKKGDLLVAEFAGYDAQRHEVWRPLDPVLEVIQHSPRGHLAGRARHYRAELIVFGAWVNG